MENEAFRFLTFDEFQGLPWNRKAAYLKSAADELELRQRTLRAQMTAYAETPKPAVSITPMPTAPRLD